MLQPGPPSIACETEPGDSELYAPEPDTLELDATFLKDIRLVNACAPPVAELLERLRQSSSEWRDTVDALTDLIFMVDAQGRVVRTNRTLEHWGLGSVRTVVGTELHALAHPECRDPACYLRRAWRCFRERSELHKPHVVETEDPELGRFLEVTLHRIDHGVGSCANRSFAVVVLRDNTEIHRERLRQWHRDQTQTLETVARGIAHEIGNPLAAMKTSLQVLHGNFDTFDEEKKRLYVERILEGTNRVWSIVEHVLHGRGRQVERLQAICVRDTLRRVHSMFCDQASTQGISLAVSPPAVTAYLLAEPTALDEVLANLLSNAFEACGPSADVAVSVQVEPDAIRLMVKDTGCGISHHNLGKIFQPFFTTKSRGSGIGMTHVAHLMEQMDGRIELESTEGVGTEVILTFRRAGSPP